MRKIASYKVARFRQNLLRKMAADSDVASGIARLMRPGHKPVPWSIIKLFTAPSPTQALLLKEIGKNAKPGIDLLDLETWGPTKERAEVYDRISRESGGKLNPAEMESELFNSWTPAQLRAAKERNDRLAEQSVAGDDTQELENAVNTSNMVELQNKAVRREAIKQKISAYAPWVGGGAGLGALLGGGIGYGASKKTGGTLLGALLGGVGGGAAGGLGKYLYDKHAKK